MNAPIPSSEFMSQSKSVIEKAKQENEDNFDDFLDELRLPPEKDEDGVDIQNLELFKSNKKDTTDMPF
jgi:hypothetical protein